MGSKVDYAGYYLFVLVLRIPIEIVASPGCGDVGMPHLCCDSPQRDIEISKTDITNGKEIPGARLQVIDSNGNTVQEWTSGNTPYTFKLPSGIYTLIERKPADGFVTAEDIVFTVTRRGEGDYDIQHVKMEDDVTKVKISKKDITNKKELPGAKLKI